MSFLEAAYNRLRSTNVRTSRLAVGSYRGFRGALGRVGLDVVLKNFYSPIPNLRTLPGSIWERRGELDGVRLDLPAQLEFLGQSLGPYIRAFDLPREKSSDPHRFFSDNPSYGPGDAEVLYGMIRHLKPRRMIELGSGYTTLLIAETLAQNEGAPADYRVFDPFPTLVTPELPGLTELGRTPAEELPVALFSELEAGDILFVDTTHTVKMGGDVNHVVLEVLPSLGSGVVVHFHDVFLPWEYPRSWLEDFGLFWTEQYLLQAFLAFNDEFEIMCALHALSREYPERLEELMPSWGDGASPGAFWIRRR